MAVARRLVSRACAVAQRTGGVGRRGLLARAADASSRFPRTQACQFAQGRRFASSETAGKAGTGADPEGGATAMLYVIAASSFAAFGYMAYTMIEEDVQGRRGIFREDHLTSDAADAATLAAGDEPEEEPDWKRRLRSAAASYAVQRATTGSSDTASNAPGKNPRVLLEMELLPLGPGAALPPTLVGDGHIEIELRADAVPKTAENFRLLCSGERGKVRLVTRDGSSKRTIKLAYQGTAFHRIIPGFMVQGGDITNGDGTGGRSVYGGRFDDENFSIKHGGAGAVAMANRGPGTNSSQFYITLGRAPWLDGKHVVFGRVVKGMDVVEQIGTLGSEAGMPAAKVVIKRSSVIQQPSNEVDTSAAAAADRA